jgi:microcystin-dependent protein
MSTTGRLQLPYPESTDSADVPRDIKALADRVEALTAWIRQADLGPDVVGMLFPGDLKFTAIAAAPPAGWLLCDGVSYLRTTYQALFDALGGAASPWGLPDGTHFRVPDLRGRAPMGAGQNTLTGSVIRSRGDLVGEEKHLMAAAELVSHTHVYDDTSPYNSGANQTAPGSQQTYYGTQTNPKTTGPNTPTGTAFNVVGPSTVVAAWIKT